MLITLLSKTITMTRLQSKHLKSTCVPVCPRFSPTKRHQRAKRENKAGQCMTLTPQLVVVRAALRLAATVAHLTSVLLIVHPETKLFALWGLEIIKILTVTINISTPHARITNTVTPLK